MSVISLLGFAWAEIPSTPVFLLFFVCVVESGRGIPSTDLLTIYEVLIFDVKVRAFVWISLHLYFHIFERGLGGFLWSTLFYGTALYKTSY